MKHLLLSLIAAFSITGANAQWMSTGPLGGGSVNCLAVIDSAVFAGTQNGLYCTVNNGDSWAQAGVNLPGNLEVTAMATSGRNIVIGTYEGLFISFFISFDGGSHWAVGNSQAIGYNLNALLFTGYSILAATNNGLYMSADSGNSWTLSGSGIPPLSQVNMLSRTAYGIFADDFGNGLFLSTDNGSTWVETDSGINSFDINTLITSGPNLLLGTGGGMYLSVDHGVSWRSVSNAGEDLDITALANAGETIFAGSYAGVYTPTDNNAWQYFGTGLPAEYVNCMTTCKGYLYAGVSDTGGVFQFSLPDSILSVQQLSLPVAAQFKLYPNPSVGNCQLAVGNDLVGHVIDVYDAQGRLVFTSEIRDLQSQINMDLASGIYIATLKTAAGVATQKLVIEK